MDELEKNLEINWRIGIVFVLTGIFVGLLLTVQFKSSIPSSSFISDELKAQKQLVESYIDEQALFKTRIIGLRSQIEKAQEKARVVVENNNLEMLKELKSELGLEFKRGRGVKIILDDGLFVDRASADSISQSLINASDLRDIVNLLRASNAEAIAINDQRIIASTSISSVGNTILVNNYHLLPPFTIVGIGDPQVLMQRINDPLAIPDLQKRKVDLNIQLEATKENGLVAPVYNGNLAIKYIKEYKDSE